GRGGVDRHGRARARDPGRPGRGQAAAGTAVLAAEAAARTTEPAAGAAAPDEHVAELARGDRSLELVEGRGRIAPREATHRHDRPARRELDGGGALRAVRGDEPAG